MRIHLLSLLLFFCCVSAAQRPDHFNLVFGFGPGYSFNDNTLNRYIDHSQMIGLNYIVTNKAQRIIFNPGINYCSNQYHSPFQGNHLVHINQNVFDLTLDMLLKISKTRYLRAGIFISKLDHSQLFISETELTGRAYTSQNTEEIRKSYQASEYHAGVTVGLCIPFKLFKREHRFDIKLTQIVSPVVNADYHTDAALTGKELKVLSVKGKPTMLIFAIEINLQKGGKKKKDPEEEKEGED